jgi:hypothetical protein
MRETGCAASLHDTTTTTTGKYVILDSKSGFLSRSYYYSRYCKAASYFPFYFVCSCFHRAVSLFIRSLSEIIFLQAIKGAKKSTGRKEEKKKNIEDL